MKGDVIKYENGCVTIIGSFEDIMTNLTFIYASLPDAAKDAWSEVPEAYRKHKKEINKNSLRITPEFIKKINSEV